MKFTNEHGSKVNNIIKRGLGKIKSLITRGFGKTLVVVVSTKAGGGSLPVPYIPYKEVFGKDIFKHIKTQKIKVPDEEQEITVDVLLIKHTGEISVDAVLKSVKGKYTEVKVYMEGEVKIYD